MATKKKSTALSWIVAEAKNLKKKYPKRFSTWKEYVAQASAIYASKHKGKSPVGKKKVVLTKKKAVKAKVGDPVYNAYKKAPIAVKKIVDTLDSHDSYTNLNNAAKKLKKLGWEMDFSLDGSITKLSKIKKTIKKVGAKTKAKTAPARSTHKDTKSHNVNIRVVSGYKQTPEIILGKVGNVSLLKSLAPEVKLRITRGKKIMSNRITSSSDISSILKKFITPSKIQTQEYALAMFLNNNSNVLAIYQFGMGGFTATVMDKRLLMAAALKLGATSIILCHNHPSGKLNPSSADIAITKEIAKIANIHDMRVLDHVILTKDGYYSFADNGLI